MIGMAIGLALPAGLNAYIPLIVLGIAGRVEWVQLKAPYSLLGEWWVLAIMGVLLVVEFFADKVPVLDTANDVVHTIIRPLAGAIAFAGASGVVTRIDPTIAFIIGLLLAGSVHGAKAAARPVVNAATGGVGGPVLSLVEDFAALVSSIIAVLVPMLSLAIVVGFVAFIAWALSRWRARAHAMAG